MLASPERISTAMDDQDSDMGISMDDNVDTDFDDSFGSDDSGIETGSDCSDKPVRQRGLCSTNCWCRQLKQWLHTMADRSQDMTMLDPQVDEATTNTMKPLANLAKQNYDPYPSLACESFRFCGERDRRGRPHGRGCAYFPNGRKFVGEFWRGQRQGDGQLFDREGSLILEGYYKADRLHGLCTITYAKSSTEPHVQTLEATFVRGVAHGPARKFAGNLLIWLGRYRRGLPYGLCWKRSACDSDGWLVGVPNAHGRITDDAAVYLYPDLHSALAGSWRSDVMTSARFASVTGFHMGEGLPAPSVVVLGNSSTFRQDVSGMTRISSSPMQRDPFESLYVRCGQSSVAADAGQGLFVRRDLSAGSVVAFYNGIRIHDCHAFNDWTYNSYKIRLNEKKKQILDISPEHRSMDAYSATLAHKVNHSFAANARFTDFSHPRFGRILCVKLTQSLKKGDEVFCNYGYSLCDCPQWYKQLYNDTCKEQGNTTV